MEILKMNPIDYKGLKAGPGRPTIYPFADLQPGDYFEIPLSSVANKPFIVSHALYNFKKRHNKMHWETAVRTEYPNVRVYRIA